MKDANDLLRDGELGDPEAALASAAPMPGAPVPAADAFRGKWLPLADAMPDLFDVAPPAPRWLLTRHVDGKARGVLRVGKVGLFIAAGGVGKTQALVQLAVAVAVGGAQQWLDTFDVANPGKVLLALAEEDEDEVRRRIRMAAELLGLRREARELVLRNIVALPLAGTPVGFVEKDQSGNVQTTTFLAALQSKLAESQGWSLVVLDPLARWAGPDSEKDNAAATRFIEAVETLVRAPGSPTVLVAHHVPKSTPATPKAGGEAVPVTPRGSSALQDGARWVAALAPELRRKGDELPVGETVRFEIVKSNYAERGDPITLVRDKRYSGALRPMSPAEKQECAKHFADKAAGNTGAPPTSSAVRADDY